MLDKQALMHALRSDKEMFENAIRNSSLMGKIELTSQFLESVASGKFDLNPDVKQEEVKGEDSVQHKIKKKYKKNKKALKK